MTSEQTSTTPARQHTPGAVAKAIIEVGKKVKQLTVDEKNDHGGYAYVSVDKFYQEIGKLMAEAGLALLIDETESRIDAGASGKPWLFAHYTLAFMHDSGAMSDPLRRSLAMPISGPQAYGAAQSYVEKQFLRQVFKVPTGEKDADATAQDDAPAPRQAPRAGMVRAADVPPQPTTPLKQNGNDTAYAAENRQRAETYRDAMQGKFAECKVPEDVRKLIEKNGKALESVKALTPDIYDEIMAESNRITNEMYASA